MINPIKLFEKWFAEEKRLTKVRIPTACCLSTIGLDNFPNARFVSLKEVVNDAFIVAGPINSRKGFEINRANKVALTFWWAETEKQVRIQGEAKKISDILANKYFDERGRDSQLVSIVSEQGKEIANIEMLIDKYNEVKSAFYNLSLQRPEHWGGYYITPVRMEFLEFNETRFHGRRLFEVLDNGWSVKWLQP
jgi:pyridoxamine 5'-phosphate oxidase